MTRGKLIAGGLVVAGIVGGVFLFRKFRQRSREPRRGSIFDAARKAGHEAAHAAAGLAGSIGITVTGEDGSSASGTTHWSEPGAGSPS